jgi:hypothetical protein
MIEEDARNILRIMKGNIMKIKMEVKMGVMQRRK